MKNFNPGVVFPVVFSAVLGVAVMGAALMRTATSYASMVKFLDEKLFPAIIRFGTHRLHISLLLVMWVLLLIGGGWTAWEFIGGNYMNGISAIMACILLLMQNKHHKTVRKMHAHHKREIASLHDKIDAISTTLAATSAHIRKAGPAK